MSIHHISKRVQNIAPSATKAMPVLAAKIGDCVSLGQGVPVFETPSHILDGVINAMRNDPTSGRYTLQPGLPQLRKAVANDFKSHGQQCDAETEVGITVGAMEALLATIMTIVEDGDEVILPSPTYASHTEQVVLSGGVPVFAPLRTEDWGLDIQAIQAAITPRTRAIILCSPGNPTGAVFEQEDIRALLNLAAENNIYVIADLTYNSLVYDMDEPALPATYTPDPQRLISIFSMSKKYALTGWRIGGLVADAELMESIQKVHDAAVVCAPTISQHAALAALQGPQHDVEQMRQELQVRRDLCCQRLDNLHDYFSYVKPRGAFYVMMRYNFSEIPSSAMAERVLREARVITVPGESYGLGGENHLRISFGGTENDINKAFDRLDQWCSSL
ncbi:MAG: pyridoxal phosphate-dependent aminotransferase [Desulfovibrio sp.]